VAAAQGLQKEFKETEEALAEATSRWMQLELEKGEIYEVSLSGLGCFVC
jgi:hypothetical protein